jgi:GTP-binding protein
MKFIDHVNINIASGAGGNGIVAWRREKYEPMGGPAGGDGGRGGDVIMEATEDLNTLLEFRFRALFAAEDGERGRPKNQHGKRGKSLVLRVPCGTIVKDPDTGNVIADLTEPGQQAMVAEGGRGGRGNTRFLSNRRQSPQFCEPGEPGVERTLHLELKLIADVGLVGMPNAGKSTLISVLSAAKPKIADYPFTTLTPNLGVIKRPNGDGVLMADIPGLIEGASEGHGLGHEFLRHVERNRLLLHLVDISGLEHDPIEAYQTINSEIAKHSEILAKKPQLLLLTKADTLDDELINHWVEEFTNILPKNAPMMVISSIARQGLDELTKAIFTTLDAIPKSEVEIPVAEDIGATNHDDSHFDVFYDGDVYEVVGGKVERLIRTTDPRNMAAVHRMWNIYKAMGVQKALIKAGAQEGDTVVICGDEFSFQPDIG